MGVAAKGGIVAPNFRTPRLIGIFSVVFASELLIVGLCMGGYAAILPTFGRLMESSQKQMEVQAAASRKAELDALDVQAKDAKTEEQRIEFASRRRLIEAGPESPFAGVMEVNKVQMTDKSFIRYTWIDVVSGLALNVLMLASGIGLLHWRPWAWTLGVWTAGLKAVRLVLLYGYFIIAIVPPYAQRLGIAASHMMGATRQMTGARTVAWMDGRFYVRLYTIMYSGFGLGVMLVGVIYPAIVLWCLTRPGARSACSGLLKTPREPNQPC